MGDQPSIYSPEGEGASWVLDLAAIRMHEMSNLSVAPSRGDVSRAQARMSEYGQEVRRHVIDGDAFGQRVIRSFRQRAIASGARTEDVDRQVRDFREQLETRDAGTGSTSLGAFLAPQFWLDKFALYRSSAAPIVNAAMRAPLPTYGMTVDVPAITQGVGAVQQQGENTSASAGVSSSATYATAPVLTFTTGQWVSQQVLDRTGPGIAYDAWHAAQAARELTSAFDGAVAKAIIVGAQLVADNASSTFNVGTLYGDVANASQLVLNSPPPAIRPTHIFIPGGTGYGFMSQVNSTGQPIWSPLGNVRGGTQVGPTEGWSGYQIMGSDVYFDDNMGSPSAGYANIIVGAPADALLVMEADPIVDVYPEAGAISLTAWIDVREYAAFAILYPTGFAVVNGGFYKSAF